MGEAGAGSQGRLEWGSRVCQLSRELVAQSFLAVRWSNKRVGASHT